MRRSLLLLCIIAGVWPSLAHAADRPNVVMIIADDQGWTDFGFMGHKVIQTPHLDKLATESALFPNGYVPTSLCRASLATLLTGLYAHQHKICCNDPPDGIDRNEMHPFIKAAPTVPRLLAAAGYRCLQTGKYWEGHYANAGFTAGMTTTGRHGDEGLVIGRQTMQPIYDFIAADCSKPFFIWYAPMMPHQPHNPPERILTKYRTEGRDARVAAYWAMCEWLDESVGDLLGFLDRNGLRENTLVVFVVDNGWVQSTGPPKPNDQFSTRSKLTPYDMGVRTPVMLRRPGHTKPSRYHDLVSTIDLAPTILNACGVKLSKDMGLNLMPVASGKGRLPRHAVFGEIFLHTSVDLQQPSLNLTHRWVREGDWKLIVPVKSSVELYNLKDDPFEGKNLAITQSQRVRNLRDLLDRWYPQ